MIISREEIENWGLWSGFDTISLSEMGAVKLMNRIDTKFLLPMNLLRPLLEEAAKEYRVQVVEGRRVASYDSLYFDTVNLEMFTRHHDRQLRRNKVRTRTYIDSDLFFLEIKCKNNKGRTKKRRIQIDGSFFERFQTSGEAVDFLEGVVKYKADELVPQLHTQFNRITLVDKAKTERLTIDLNLTFVNVQSGVTKELGPLAVIELKQDGLVHSKMRDILLALRIHPYKISKYCIGVTMTNPSAKSNRFKKKILHIKKLTELQEGSQTL